MIIGVTGSIGAGKSSFAAALVEEIGRSRGPAVLFDADRVAREVLQEQLQLIAAEFGKDIIGADGAPDRARIAERAFRDEESAGKLNSMIHPGVYARARVELDALRDRNAAVILDVPLLFESGMNELCDVVFAVTADDERRRKRAEKFGDVRARERFQWSQAAKAARADVVISNDGSLEELRAKIPQAIEKIFS